MMPKVQLLIQDYDRHFQYQKRLARTLSIFSLSIFICIKTFAAAVRETTDFLVMILNMYVVSLMQKGV